MLEMRTTSEQLTFLLALVAFLPDGTPVSVSDIAEHFGVEKSRVRKAVRLIGVSGIPGEAGQYLHGDLFDIDWDALELRDQVTLINRVAIDEAPRLASREAAALIAGLQSISTIPGIAGSSVFSGLIDKLTRGSVEPPTAVTVSAMASNATTDALYQAIQQGSVVQFEYRNAAGELRTRSADPLRVDLIDGVGYLRAWCHLRKTQRTFRLDRISDVELTDEVATHTAEMLDESAFAFTADTIGTEVTVEFDSSGTAIIGDYAPTSLSAGQTPGRAAATVILTHPSLIWRLVSELPAAVILAPESARSLIHSIATAGITRHPPIAK